MGVTDRAPVLKTEFDVEQQILSILKEVGSIHLDNLIELFLYAEMKHAQTKKQRFSLVKYTKQSDQDVKSYYIKSLVRDSEKLRFKGKEIHPVTMTISSRNPELDKYIEKAIKELSQSQIQHLIYDFWVVKNTCLGKQLDFRHYIKNSPSETQQAQPESSKE